jgi:hypothetical protein
MEEWMQKGTEQWKVNMTKKREREAGQLTFDLSQAEKFNNQVHAKLEEASAEVFDGIDKFEKSLQRKGISTKVDKVAAADAINLTLSQGHLTMQSGTIAATKLFDATATTRKGNFTLTSTGLKSRAKKILGEDDQKQRIKRRRRLITAQEHLFTKLHG